MKYYKESDIRGAKFNTISTPYSQGWNNGIDSILENATPIEIPNGRLIDADALKDDFDCIGFNDYDDYNRALRIIDDAPTIIEAQEDTEA